jgi:hypothetical protein
MAGGNRGESNKNEKINAKRINMTEKTITPAVIEANRENAQKSTGPKTAAGKEAVRNNALKHGLLTKTLVFKDEEESAQFEAFCAELGSDLAPQGALEKMMVTDIAVSWWKLQSVHRLQVQELDARQGRAADILNTFGSNAREMDGYFLSQPKALSTSVGAGWECNGLILRQRSSKSKEDDLDYGGTFEGAGNVTFEAKLESAAESLIRYENIWKKNLYRAIKTLRELQEGRLK